MAKSERMMLCGLPFLLFSDGISQVLCSRSICSHRALRSSPIRQQVDRAIQIAASVVTCSPASGAFLASSLISSSLSTRSRSVSLPPILAFRILALGSCSIRSRSTAKRNIWRISEKTILAIRFTPRARRASVTSVI